MTPAEHLIAATILRKGPITFREFMELALYHPQVGYYATSGERIGRRGDYYTSTSLGPIFGRTLSRQFMEMLDILGGGALVEMGAGQGYLARDVLGEMAREGREVSYFIVERSPAMRRAQEKNLKDFSSVEWVEDLEDLEPMEGVFFSNELVDAFPVHMVEMTKDGLKEVLVDWRAGEFMEVLAPPTTPRLEEYFKELGVELPPGFRTEVNLDAVDWLNQVSSKLKRGFLITIDYGYPSHELYQDYRRKGTLMAYYCHQACEDPYVRVGEQDLTSHVNFSALAHWGKKVGLKVLGFLPQAHFLLGLGILELLSQEKELERLAAKTLLMPGGMGEIFKVLIQAKGVEPPGLLGLSMAPNRGSLRL